MYTSGKVLQASQTLEFPEFKRFELKDRELIQPYIDTFKPFSCEYNFSNLFTWQDAYKLSWTLYQERLLIYDGISNCAFMPLGEEFCPEELVILSLNLKNVGLIPDFCLLGLDYLEKFPEIKTYYNVKKERDHSEYIYDTDSLCDLTGAKLHKKRNLISQFNRCYPDFQIHLLTQEFKYQALMLAQDLLNRQKNPSDTLNKEYHAIEQSFLHFEQLGLEGLVLKVGTKVAAFSVFSQLAHSTYDIQFEKSNMEFKGAAQVINHETAKHLKNRCRYMNREQDLGIKGLRQAKLSYEPIKLITPYSLTFAPIN